jgi:hypothetical protein
MTQPGRRQAVSSRLLDDRIHSIALGGEAVDQAFSFFVTRNGDGEIDIARVPKIPADILCAPQ